MAAEGTFVNEKIKQIPCQSAAQQAVNADDLLVLAVDVLDKQTDAV